MRLVRAGLQQAREAKARAGSGRLGRLEPHPRRRRKPLYDTKCSRQARRKARKAEPARCQLYSFPCHTADVVESTMRGRSLRY